MSLTSSCGSSCVGDDQQELGERELALAEDGAGLREQFLRLRRVEERHVAFAADRQQQRVDAGGVDGVDAMHAGQHGGNHRAGELVDQLAEHRVFLRRPADDGERPDRVAAAVHCFDLQHREGVREAVVAEVIAERAFGEQAIGVDRADDAEVAVGVDRQARRRGGSCGRGGGRARRRSPARSSLRAAASRRRPPSPAGRRRRCSRETACPRAPRRRDGRRCCGGFDSGGRLRGRARTGCRRVARGTCRGSSGAGPARARPRCRPPAA